ADLEDVHRDRHDPVHVQIGIPVYRRPAVAVRGRLVLVDDFAVTVIVRAFWLFVVIPFQRQADGAASVESNPLERHRCLRLKYSYRARKLATSRTSAFFSSAVTGAGPAAEQLVETQPELAAVEAGGGHFHRYDLAIHDAKLTVKSDLAWKSRHGQSN